MGMTAQGSDKSGSADDAGPLHVHRYRPAGPPEVLALHGLTGHGRRWRHLAEQHLPGGNELRARYANLNIGQQRMNVGNRLRAALKDGLWTIPQQD